VGEANAALARYDGLLMGMVNPAVMLSPLTNQDGNGRIGLLLISLILFSKQRLASLMFYLSAYLESHRDEYYARLRAIPERGD
jgi:hypothetical protein